MPEVVNSQICTEERIIDICDMMFYISPPPQKKTTTCLILINTKVKCQLICIVKPILLVAKLYEGHTPVHKICQKVQFIPGKPCHLWYFLIINMREKPSYIRRVCKVSINISVSDKMFY